MHKGAGIIPGIPLLFNKDSPHTSPEPGKDSAKRVRGHPHPGEARPGWSLPQILTNFYTNLFLG